MKIVIAPDSFKGSLTAVEACAALREGARRVFPASEIVSLPLADGGEGTLDALLGGARGLVKTRRVRDPLGRPVEARWGILPDGRAIIEMAQASGLALVPSGERDAPQASSYGTGQLIGAALDAGCRQFLLAIGGSATTDGGLGALTALGLRAFDARERVLEPGGAALAQLARLDFKFFDARLAKTSFTILCDVTNPLHGPNGAAHIYAAQKGASPAQIEILDDALQHYAAIVANSIGKDEAHRPGTGAAGGIGFSLLAFCDAKLNSGVETILEATRFSELITDADLILTGEGSLDAQTLNGKTIAGVCRTARTQGVPVIAFGGSIHLTGTQMNDLGLLSAFSLADGPQSLEFCVKNSATLLANSAERALRLWPTPHNKN